MSKPETQSCESVTFENSLTKGPWSRTRFWLSRIQYRVEFEKFVMCQKG